MDRRTFVSAAAAAAASALLPRGAHAQPVPTVQNVVLIHGLFADGSSWSEVIPRLQAKGIHATGVEDEFLEHAHAEQDHADRVAKRITELGGKPNLNPEGLATRSHAQYGEGETLEDMIKEDLIAERIAIATYSEIVRWLGNDDPTTRRMMEDLLATEEEHADDMAKLLMRVSK